MIKKARKTNCLKAVPAFSTLFSIVLTYLLVAHLIGASLTYNVDGLSDSDLVKASNIDFGNHIYPYARGLFQLYRTGERDIEKAVIYFKDALHLNTAHLYSWFGLAMAYDELNQKEDARLLFETLLRKNKINRDLSWDTGMYFLGNNEIWRGMPFLMRFMDFEPESSSKVFDLIYQFPVTTEDIVSSSVKDRPELHDHFFQYLARRRTADDIITAWQMISRSEVTESTKLMLCDVLIDNKEYGVAKKIWHKLTNDSDNSDSIQNGDFEYEIRNSCFDWRKGIAEGVEIERDEQFFYSGGSSARISFDGQHNPGISLLAQIVPVRSGERYRLSTFIKSDEITTKNGIVFEVRGDYCKQLYTRSAVFTGTRLWTRVQIEFKVPDECNSIIVSVMRDKSSKLNNKIKGVAWVDDMRLTSLGELDD